ncbi:MAG TPA: YMGG-like glycine zipper-containing protein [Thermodesulfovibrionales bacterium]|nr:YMGG-like glycine zipper-containing protein [Thermodesulfovibrionales bacterium]
MKRAAIIFVGLILLVASGCSGMSRTQQTTLSGAAIGAAGGAVVGAFAGGSPAVGAVVGAGIGGVTGYIIGEHGEHHYH